MSRLISAIVSRPISARVSFGQRKPLRLPTFTVVDLARHGDTMPRAERRRLVTEVSRLIFETERELHGVPYMERDITEDVAGTCRGIAAKRLRRLYVIRDVGGKVVGSGMLVQEAHQNRLAGLYLAREWRGLGYGRAMLNRLVADAHRLRFKTLSLEVQENYAPAIGLYTSLGFRAYGRVDDNLLMMASVSDAYRQIGVGHAGYGEQEQRPRLAGKSSGLR